jgi:hypothetical protein
MNGPKLKRAIAAACMAVLSSAATFAAELAPGEAIVLMQMSSGKPHTITAIEFKAIDSDVRFTIYREKAGRPMIVPAGSYYVGRLQSVFADVFMPEFDPPADASKVLRLTPGAVTYIGDWQFKRQDTARGPSWDFGPTFAVATVKAAAGQHPELMRLPLRGAVADGTVFEMPWP